MRRRGELELVRRGLYGLPGRKDSYRQRVAAACLHPASPAASGLTATHLWTLWQEPELIEVTVRAPRKIRIDGITVHRSADIRAEDVTVLDGIRVTTPTRTLVDLGRVLPETEVARVLHHALTVGLVDPVRLMQMRIEVGEHGRNGAGVLGRLLESLPSDAAIHDSGPEFSLRCLLVAAGLPDPVAQWPVEVAGRRYHLDLAYPDAMLALEYDGHDWHSSPTQLAADTARQAKCESVGWTFIRVRKHDLGLGRYGLLSRVRDVLDRSATNPAA
jgi:hypothetical protein